MKQAVVDTDVRWSPEAVKVHEWRYELLKRHGYTDGAAAVLAQRVDVDLHLALKLIGNCPEQKALNILL